MWWQPGESRRQQSVHHYCIEALVIGILPMTDPDMTCSKLRLWRQESSATCARRWRHGDGLAAPDLLV